MNNIKETLLDIFFPKFCLGCDREGEYLCSDCKACLEISENIFCLCRKPKIILKDGKCKDCQSHYLNGLYFPLSYQKTLVKKLINHFRNKPYIKDLAYPLSNLIIDHFLLLEKEENFFKDRVIIPLPINKKKRKKIGYNPNNEIAKNLSFTLQIPSINCLKKNRSNYFLTEQKKEIKDKKVFLVTGLYKEGLPMKKAAKTLKENGTKEVWGIAVARGIEIDFKEKNW
jgi:competence protein ComFC